MRLSGSFSLRGRIRAAVYRLLWGCADAFHRSGEACLHIAAGLLRQDDLTNGNRAYWRTYGTSADDVDAGLELWERQMYSSVLNPADRVLLVGCGAGRDLLGLLELGYDVTGLDPTPELVEHAKAHLTRRGLNARIIRGFVESADIDGHYDAVIFAGCCYCYVRGTSTRIATLARMKTHLNVNGRVVVTYGGFSKRSTIPVALTRTASRLARTDWEVESGDSFSRAYFVPRLLRYEHRFIAGEVVRECSQAGLRIVREEVTTPFYYVVATV